MYGSLHWNVWLFTLECMALYIGMYGPLHWHPFHWNIWPFTLECSVLCVGMHCANDLCHMSHWLPLYWNVACFTLAPFTLECMALHIGSLHIGIYGPSHWLPPHWLPSHWNIWPFTLECSVLYIAMHCADELCHMSHRQAPCACKSVISRMDTSCHIHAAWMRHVTFHLIL